MKLVGSFLLFAVVVVALSSASEGRGKREAIKQCKLDSECPLRHSCVFGFCSSDDTRHTFEGLQKAKTLRTRNRAKKVGKRSQWSECVDDFECPEPERCHGGMCQPHLGHL